LQLRDPLTLIFVQFAVCMLQLILTDWSIE